jgi:hypothetical protein
MFDTLYAQVGAALMILVCAFAYLKGDQPERIGAATYALAWLATVFFQDDSDLLRISWAMFAVDLVVLCVFAGLAWRAGRAWPVWASAFQLLVVVSHVMNFLDLRPSLTAFYTVLNIAGYGILVCLAVGAFWAWQERRAAGLE